MMSSYLEDYLITIITSAKRNMCRALWTKAKVYKVLSKVKIGSRKYKTFNVARNGCEFE